MPTSITFNLLVHYAHRQRCARRIVATIEGMEDISVLMEPELLSVRLTRPFVSSIPIMYTRLKHVLGYVGVYISDVLLSNRYNRICVVGAVLWLM